MTFDIPNKDGVWTFNAPSTWVTWAKPTQYNAFFIYVIGGGGGGGNGAGGAAGTNRPGGGSGGTGGWLTINTPSYLLPETMYIYVGRGGYGGQGINGSGQVGDTSVLAYYPNSINANLIATASGGGGGGNTLGGSTAGTAGGTSALNQSIFSITGQSGVTGQPGGVFGTPASVVNSNIPSIGGGGGSGVNTSNTQNAGGSISLLDGNTIPGGIGAVAGGSGWISKKPFFSFGGAGGGGNASGTGGRGGDGAGGAGGGGGGGGLTGGIGGKGGDGFVIIIGY